MKIPFTGVLQDTDLDKLVERAKDYNRPTHELIEKAREHRRMEQQVAMPPGTRKTQIQVRNAFLFDMTQRMSAATIKNWPWIEAVADDITQESERRASKKERHTSGALKRAALEAGTHQDPFPRVTWGQYGDGMGVYKWYHRPERWLPWPKRNGDASGYMSALKRFKMSRYPFVWRSLDALTYNPLYGDESKVFVAEITRRAIADLERTFGGESVKSALDTLEAGADRGITQLGGTVEFQELTTLSHIYYRVNGKTIHRVEHGNPFIHYYEARGITTEANIPGKDSLPLTWGLLKYSPLLDTMFTTIAEGFMVAGIPTPFLKTDPNSPEFARLFGPDGRPISQQIALGQINPTQGDISLPLSQAMPAMLNDSLKAIMGLADAVNLPAALRGQGIGSDWSGYLANTVLHVVLTLLSGPLHNHEAAFTQMIRDYWWTIQNKVGEDVWVWHQLKGRRGRWAPLGPDDIRDFYEVYVHLRPSLPRDEVQMAQTGLQIWQAGGIDLRTYLTKWLEEEFPDEIEERIMLERLFNREEIDTIRLTALMRRLAPDSPVVEQILMGMEGQQQGFPGAQPGVQEAAPFAAGALGGAPAGTPQVTPSGPQLGP
jgi:hypothetical protein